eukprot:361082-Chlamydomonas_euryale.AAC.6
MHTATQRTAVGSAPATRTAPHLAVIFSVCLKHCMFKLANYSGLFTEHRELLARLLSAEVAAVAAAAKEEPPGCNPFWPLPVATPSGPSRLQPLLAPPCPQSPLRVRLAVLPELGRDEEVLTLDDTLGNDVAYGGANLRSATCFISGKGHGWKGRAARATVGRVERPKPRLEGSSGQGHGWKG